MGDGKLRVPLMVHEQFELDHFQELSDEGLVESVEFDNDLTNQHCKFTYPTEDEYDLEDLDSHVGRNLQTEQIGLLWLNTFTSCYPSVKQTSEILHQWTVDYSDYVTIEKIGESYLKTEGLGGDYLELAIIDVPSDSVEEKVPMMIVGGHHSRELPPPATLVAWVSHLLESYGNDADITWVLNRTVIHMIPIANPDGRSKVQSSADFLRWRKNVRPNGCNETMLKSAWDHSGTDLNRNYPMFYGNDTGSSSNPCSGSFRGTGPLSEPEVASIYNYARNLFDSSYFKGTPEEAAMKVDEPCGVDNVGMFLDVHSYGKMVYYPWGNDIKYPPAGNNHSILAMASKLASFTDEIFTLWGPGSVDYQYVVSGDATDAIYGQLCIASFGYELGSSFWADCDELNGEIKPFAFQSLLYAAKQVYAPFKLPLGPDILNITTKKNGSTFTVSAVVSEEENLRYIDSHLAYVTWYHQNISKVTMYLNVFPGEGEGVEMMAVDGAFDEVTEAVTFDLDTSALPDGKHIIYLQGTDSDGDSGPVSALFVTLPLEVNCHCHDDVPHCADPADESSYECDHDSHDHEVDCHCDDVVPHCADPADESSYECAHDSDDHEVDCHCDDDVPHCADPADESSYECAHDSHDHKD